MAIEEEEVDYIIRLNLEYRECNHSEQRHGPPHNTPKCVSELALICLDHCRIIVTHAISSMSHTRRLLAFGLFLRPYAHAHGMVARP